METETAETEKIEDQEFYEQCLRQIQRPLDLRIRYGFIQVKRPPEPNRSFDSMQEYREYMARTQPAYLGYGDQ